LNIVYGLPSVRSGVRRRDMEARDLELINRLIPTHEELRMLMEEHETLERELEDYSAKRYLTPAEELEKKRIQKLKLAGKDRIEAILSDFRKQSES
jgi:uncharacterized protein YdcH (DUF465 family)